MSTLRINNIEAKSVPASPTIDEKIKLTNSSGDVLVHVDGKTSGITTIGINTTAGNIKFDQNSNIVVTGIITATKFVGTIEPTDLTVGGNLSGSNANFTGELTVAEMVGHTGDTHTKLSFPANDTIAFTTGGTERARINSSGHMGLGTNNPTDTGGYGRALDITGGASGAAIYLRSANGDTGQISLGSGDLTIRTRQADPIIFNTNNGERLRITSGGDVGIGTNSPQNGGLTVLRNSEARLQVWANGDGSNGKIALRADGTNTQMGTWSNHDCHLVRNSSIQATISSTGISLPAGKGIDFSATSDATGVTSELFDDYERGVHLISVLGSNSNPSVNLSANHKRLYYTKIGSMVHVTGELRWTINSHGGGDLRITLPFQSDSSTSCNSQGTAQTWNVNWAWRSETRDIWSEVSPGQSFLVFRLGGSGSLHEDFLQLGSTYQSTANSGYGVEYQVSLWYRTG